MNVGIIGAGHIAEKAARTLAAMDDMRCLAIGSRSLEKAQSFAAAFGVERAYGSGAGLWHYWTKSARFLAPACGILGAGLPKP